jgi:hypothetical protein
MNRPENIYLTDPVLIAGIKVGHTEQGLRYLIDHYRCLLKLEYKRTPEEIAHMEFLIKNWEIHLKLYENHNRHAYSPDNQEKRNHSDRDGRVGG